MSTPSMSCERVMRTECSFNDDKTTYIRHWPRQKSPKDCQEKCKNTSYHACHFWMHHSSNETCDLYERDKKLAVLLEVLLHWQLFIVQVCKQRNIIIHYILISYLEMETYSFVLLNIFSFPKCLSPCNNEVCKCGSNDEDCTGN